MSLSIRAHKALYTSGAVGALSGLLVYWLVIELKDELFWPPWPGVIFGIVTSVYFYFVNRRRARAWLRAAGWVVAGAISYTVAFFGGINAEGLLTSLTTIGDVELFPQRSFVYLCGGVLGAAVLAGAYHLLFGRISKRNLALLLLVGAVIPTVIRLLLSDFKYEVQPVRPFFLSLFVLWQAAMIVLLRNTATKNEEPTTNHQFAVD